MRILLAADGSNGFEPAKKELLERPWPEGTEVMVLSVAHTAAPELYDPTMMTMALHDATLEDERKRARETVEEVSRELEERVEGLAISTRVVEGHPKKAIAEVAAEWGADLILLGAHGHGSVSRHFLGSVAHGTILHAPCSVEVARSHGA